MVASTAADRAGGKHTGDTRNAAKQGRRLSRTAERADMRTFGEQ